MENKCGNSIRCGGSGALWKIRVGNSIRHVRNGAVWKISVGNSIWCVWSDAVWKISAENSIRRVEIDAVWKISAENSIGHVWNGAEWKISVENSVRVWELMLKIKSIILCNKEKESNQISIVQCSYHNKHWWERYEMTQLNFNLGVGTLTIEIP